MESAILLDHFRRPRNAGRLPEPCATGRAMNPGCGDEVELTIRVEGGAIAEVRFRAVGCPASIACASCLTELVHGKSVGQAARFGRAEIAEALGGLPQASQHAAQLALDALRGALGSCGEASGSVTTSNSVPR